MFARLLLQFSCLLPLCLSASVWAQLHSVSNSDSLSLALQQAQDGDVIELAAGTYQGQFQIDKSLSLVGEPGAIFDGGGSGSVLKISASGVKICQLVFQNWGSVVFANDAAIRIMKSASDISITHSQFDGRGFGIHAIEASNIRIANNTMKGDQKAPAVMRGDAIYVKHSTSVTITDNLIQGGRDGIYAESSSGVVIDDNRMSQMQYPVHFMYATDSSASRNRVENVVGGYAIMGSERIKTSHNWVRGATEFGLLLNLSNDSEVSDNWVEQVFNPESDKVFDGEGKGIYIYGAQDNRVFANRIETSQIGIAMAMGGEQNQIHDNAFIHNQVQVKYVGESQLDWSGNYWSSYQGWDLNQDGFGDQFYRPNDALDKLFWIYPEAKFLMSSPAVSVLRWLQQQFAELNPQGITDSQPRLSPLATQAVRGMQP